MRTTGNTGSIMLVRFFPFYKFAIILLLSLKFTPSCLRNPPLFEPSLITMCPQLACTPSTGPHASPSIKIHPVLLTQSTPLLIYVSHSSPKSPSFAMLIQGGVLCSPLVVYGWCYTPSLRLVFHTTHR